MMLLDAILLAGGDPVRDAELLHYAGGAPRKALIELGHRTFLERIVQALLDSERVRRIAIVGLPQEFEIDMGAQVCFVPNRGSLFANGAAGFERLSTAGPISDQLVVSTADIPLVTAEMIQAFIDTCLLHKVDFCYPIVTQKDMEQTFPGSGRTFVPIGRQRYAGGDIDVVTPKVLATNSTKLDQIIGERKTFWRQVRAVGLDTLLLFLIRRLTLERIEQRVEQVLGFTCKALISPHAEIAMDVDKPRHLAVVRKAWQQRQQAGAAP
jgi:GTP:adenosylcobinamide-phosphate guanylyltransferase